jgi:carboxypeptidase Taq
MSLAFARGDFSGLLSWLRTKVHREGQRHRPAELIEHIVRNRPHHRALMDSLRRKYGELYDI